MNFHIRLIGKVPMKRVFILLLLLITLFSVAQPVYADGNLRVYYAGADGSVKTALELAKFELVTDPAQADVFVLNGDIPANEAIQSRARGGEAGLVLILGPSLSETQVSELLGMPLTLTRREDAVSLTSLPLDDPLVSEIIWNGAPQVRERYEVGTPMSSVQPLVTVYEDGEWILWQGRPNEYVVNAFLDDVNPQIQEWAYYNYLIYHLVERTAGRTPLPFAEYPASPVPHNVERNILFAVIGLMIVTSFGVFFWVRRYSQSHPEALDQIVSDRTSFEVREESTGWEEVGFHRPLSGFLVALSTGVILFIPLIIYQNLILPSFILPSAQALGIWGRVTQFFNLAWFFFDMGTQAWRSSSTCRSIA
jgi:hypothetical protein